MSHFWLIVCTTFAFVCTRVTQLTSHLFPLSYCLSIESRLSVVLMLLILSAYTLRILSISLSTAYISRIIITREVSGRYVAIRFEVWCIDNKIQSVTTHNISFRIVERLSHSANLDFKVCITYISF